MMSVPSEWTKSLEMKLMMMMNPIKNCNICDSWLIGLFCN